MTSRENTSVSIPAQRDSTIQMLLVFGKPTLILITPKVTLKAYLNEEKLPVKSKTILSMII